jgi:hypothetical protein
MMFCKRRMIRGWCGIVLLAAIAGSARAGDLIVQFPKEMKVVGVEARIAGGDQAVTGKIQPGVARVGNLNGEYDIKLTLDDGTIFQGVDMGWENSDPADADAGDLTDDDRQQIQGIMSIPSFFNHTDLLRLRGDHDRAVALVQLVRDQDFVSQTGQEIIWRVELWYFKNENGGWAKLDKRVVRRERFANPDQYRGATGKLHWVGELGEVPVPGAGTATVSLPADAAATQPVSGH